MVGLVEEAGRRHGTEYPLQMTIATTDGKGVWAFRYSSEGKSRSLYFSTDMRTVREMYPERPRDRKSTRLNSSHANISYAVFCLKKKKKEQKSYILYLKVSQYFSYSVI